MSSFIDNLVGGISGIIDGAFSGPQQEAEPAYEGFRPYSDYSDDELLDQFHSDNWGKLDDVSREMICQEVENRNAAANGRDPAIVTFYDGPRSKYGSYNDIGNLIQINREHFDNPYETLDSLIHEGRHGYQSEYADDPSKYDSFTGDLIQAGNARDENGKLYNYDSGKNYDMQCDEMDSNSTASEFLMGQADRYRDDPKYLEYLNDRVKHFDKVNGALNEHGADRRSFLANQAQNAYDHGDLTEGQLKNVQAGANDPNYTDPQALRSQWVGADVSNLRDQVAQYQAENGIQSPY